mmetsp:Transcript_84225/g.239104  ORF Transcript_84225/g.239104 Transcript_84225/m.239104 type:complete len:134 (+) Transcript_84225:238-639(+)
MASHSATPSKYASAPAAADTVSKKVAPAKSRKRARTERGAAYDDESAQDESFDAMQEEASDDAMNVPAMMKVIDDRNKSGEHHRLLKSTLANKKPFFNPANAAAASQASVSEMGPDEAAHVGNLLWAMAGGSH